MPLNLPVPQWCRAVGGSSGHDIHACKLHGLFRFPEPPPSPCMVPSTSLDLPLLPEGLHPMACPYLVDQAQGHKAWAGDGRLAVPCWQGCGILTAVVTYGIPGPQAATRHPLRITPLCTIFNLKAGEPQRLIEPRANFCGVEPSPNQERAPERRRHIPLHLRASQHQTHIYQP